MKKNEVTLEELNELKKRSGMYTDTTLYEADPWYFELINGELSDYPDALDELIRTNDEEELYQLCEKVIDRFEADKNIGGWFIKLYVLMHDGYGNANHELYDELDSDSYHQQKEKYG